jgi:spermidine/putrescine transport system substrate-binding protein
MKRPSCLGFASVAAAALVVAAGCGSSTSADQTAPATSINISPAHVSGVLKDYAYEDGFTPGYVASFKKEYPKVQLETQAFDSSTQALTKLRTGAVSPDIINTCVDENAAEEVRLGVYQPLDISKIPNWKYIDPALKKLPGVEVNGKVYVIPVDAGDGGIQYDPRHVHPAPTSWADLFNPKYKGEAAMEDNPVTAIDAGALAIGIKDPLHMTEAQLQQVKTFLIAHRSDFRTWWESDTDEEQLYKTGEIWISSGYRDDSYTITKSGVPNVFVIPKEGSLEWTCGYGISAHAHNVNAAYAMLNWYASVAAETYEAKTWYYRIANTKARAMLPKGVLERSGNNQKLVNPIPASEPKNYTEWVQIWQDVKSG